MTGRRRAATGGLIGVLLLVSASCDQPAASSDPATSAPSTVASEEAASEVAVALPTPTSSGPDAYPPGSALHVLLRDGRFSTFVGIVEQHQVGRARELFGDPEHTATLFVPTDEAFRRLPPELLAGLIDDVVLSRLVRNHVAPDPVQSADLPIGDELATLGVPVAIGGTASAPTVAGVPLLDPDVPAGASVIHVVDHLLLPCHDPFLADALGPSHSEHCTSRDRSG